MLWYRNKFSIFTIFLLILITSFVFSPAYGTLLQTFDDPTPTLTDQFGVSVSISGNNVLVGAFADDTNGENVGQAHLFDATTGAFLRTFVDPTPTTEDDFGFSVSISGNNVLVGAIGDDTNGEDIGQAHLFDATTGALLKTFDDPTVTTEDQFGFWVAIDGNSVLVGARFDDTNGVDVGQAHLFETIFPTTECEIQGGVYDHWDKIIFITEGAGLRDANNIFIKPGTVLEFKFPQEDPFIPINAAQLTADHLTSIGWTFGNGSPIKASFIVITDIDYTAVCVFPQLLV